MLVRPLLATLPPSLVGEMATKDSDGASKDDEDAGKDVGGAGTEELDIRTGEKMLLLFLSTPTLAKSSTPSPSISITIETDDLKLLLLMMDVDGITEGISDVADQAEAEKEDEKVEDNFWLRDADENVLVRFKSEEVSTIDDDDNADDEVEEEAGWLTSAEKGALLLGPIDLLDPSEAEDKTRSRENFLSFIKFRC